MYRWLDEFAAGQRKRLLVMMPPGHGKSEGVSRNLPAYLLGRNPDARIIACSYTANLASDMNRDVQRLMDREEYAAAFPETRLSSGPRSAAQARRNADIFDVVGRRGYYKSDGVGGGITGRRFDFGIIDDPIKDREAANSPVQREALWRWYTGVFHTRQARNASILVCATRWHPDDLTGRLLDRMIDGTGEAWDVLRLPAIADAERHPEDPRNEGEPLWPWFRPLTALEASRTLNPGDFASLYQQRPRAEGSVEWPDECFNHPAFWFDSWPEQLLVRTMAIDPSKGKDSKSSDYSAIIKYGVTADGTEYIEADLARRPPDVICQDAAAQVKAFKPDGLYLEPAGFQELMAPMLRDAFRNAGVNVTLHLQPDQTNKNVRIRRLTEGICGKTMRFKSKSRGTAELVRQLKEFPVCDYFDGPDALEMARRLAIRLLVGRKHAHNQPTIITV